MADLTAGVIVRKGSDETVNNSETLQDDNDLFFQMAADDTWYFEARVLSNSGTTPDIKFAFTVPTGSTLSWSVIQTGTTNVAELIAPISASGTAAGVDGTGADSQSFIAGIVRVGGTPGNFQLQWAQNVANVSDTKVLTNSYLLAGREG